MYDLFCDTSRTFKSEVTSNTKEKRNNFNASYDHIFVSNDIFDNVDNKELRDFYDDKRKLPVSDHYGLQFTINVKKLFGWKN